MIDIHCHILPGIDDGPSSIEESLKMAKIAVDEGIETIINTYHYHPEFNYKQNLNIEEVLNQFNKLLKKENIDLEILIGSEVYYSNNSLNYIDKKDFHTLNNSKYILIEMETIKFPKNLCDIVYELKLRGYVPIIAHIERYNDVKNNINIIKEAVKEGALIQINSSSITKKHKGLSTNICDILLKNNMVHFIATDGHGCEIRKPLLKDAYDYVLKKYGEDRANNLFLKNAKSLVNNENISIVERSKYKIKSGILSKLIYEKFYK